MNKVVNKAKDNKDDYNIDEELYNYVTPPYLPFHNRIPLYIL